jgi:hypothetical protein
MTHLIPNFYATLHRLNAVENAKRGEAMKDFLKTSMVLVALLALFMSLRFALFAPLHREMLAATVPAPIADAEGGCAVRPVKMPCFRHANPEGGVVAAVPLQSGSADAATIATQDVRCAAQQAKFPCLHHKTPRS